MSSKGLGVAHVLGVVTLLTVTAIVAILYLKDAESAVSAKQSAEQTLDEVRGILDARTSEHQRALEDVRQGTRAPDPFADLRPK